jgi:hypothetical protein
VVGLALTYQTLVSDFSSASGSKSRVLKAKDTIRQQIKSSPVHNANRRRKDFLAYSMVCLLLLRAFENTGDFRITFRAVDQLPAFSAQFIHRLG